MNLPDRIAAFSELGRVINHILDGNVNHKGLPSSAIALGQMIETIRDHNPWFTYDNITSALSAIARSLTGKNLVNWTGRYPQLKNRPGSKRIGITMAGNIPLVGFHDFICVLVSGNFFVGKLSSKDNKLLPQLAAILCELQPDFKNSIEFTEGNFKDVDAIIATGSDNTSRYFEYYFGRYRRIIRKNRNSIAILDGTESLENLAGLGSDIFSYFGLGCRNVSKIYIPDNYDFEMLFNAVKSYHSIIDHPQYYNNYIYNRSVFLVNRNAFHDGGFFLLAENTGFDSPIGVVYYQYCSDPVLLKEEFLVNSERIQCIVGNNCPPANTPFGRSQEPELWDYADDIDTIAFLLSLE
ncbi:MAG: hypothetical protein JSV24_02545 [Bacteroidales bacterium]|nr:MAG: hypothetical protein JSV24_02545 [Bacteroidales bacterium]